MYRFFCYESKSYCFTRKELLKYSKMSKIYKQID